MSDNTNNTGTQESTAPLIRSVNIQPGTSFIANGKTYHVQDTFSIGRLETVTVMEEELTMMNSRASCHEIMQEAMKYINDYKPGDAYMLLFNKIDSDLKNQRLIHYTLRVCAAYINAEGEDIKSLTEQQIEQKINDWSEEGLDVRPFMLFAASAFGEHLQRYKNDMLNTLTELKSIKQSIATEMAINSSMANNGENQSLDNSLEDETTS